MIYLFIEHTSSVCLFCCCGHPSRTRPSPGTTYFCETFIFGSKDDHFVRKDFGSSGPQVRSGQGHSKLHNDKALLIHNIYSCINNAKDHISKWQKIIDNPFKSFVFLIVIFHHWNHLTLGFFLYILKNINLVNY